MICASGYVLNDPTVQPFEPAYNPVFPPRPTPYPTPKTISLQACHNGLSIDSLVLLQETPFQNFAINICVNQSGGRVSTLNNLQKLCALML